MAARKDDGPLDRLQARLNELEQIDFYNAWKKLMPSVTFSDFCREMIRAGIEARAEGKEKDELVEKIRELIREELKGEKKARKT